MVLRPRRPGSLNKASIFVGRIEFPDGRARLYRIDHRRWLDPRQLDHMLGPAKASATLAAIAKVIVEYDIVGHGFEHQRRAWLRGRALVDNNRQWLDVDRHRLGRVLRLCDSCPQPRKRPDPRQSVLVGGKRGPRRVTD